MVPAGDYIFCVVGFECKISQGKVTRGCDQFKLELEIEPKGSICLEDLFDHANTGWKIDTFLKSANVKLPKDSSFEFREDTAKDKGVPWINPLGLRGWCRLIEDEYMKSGETTKRKTNRVDSFYTDKPKLERRVIVAVPEEERPF